MVKVVIITGASAGMGAATAEYLSDRGYRVFGASRRAETGRPINGFTELKMDVTDESSVHEAVQYVIDQEGRIDALVNNAGLGLIGSIEDTSDAEVKALFETNVFGLLNVSRAVLPHMRQAGSGHIINISSIAGLMGLPYRGIYSATKSSVLMITEAMSTEVKNQDIRVCSILPGDFKTSVNENRRVAEQAKTSVYAESTSALNKLVNEEVQSSSDPIIIARKVEKILSTRNPKLHYKVAPAIPKLSTVLHFILPGRWYEWILMNHYKIKS